MAGLVLIAIAGLGIAGPAARAQSGSAAALFDEGYRLLDQGKLVEACEAFEASNRVQPGAGTYIALGTCREYNHQLASAWSAYQAALARARDLEKRNYASARIAQLEPRLSYLIVSVPLGQVAGLTLTRNGARIDSRVWNHALPTDGGDYIIEARAPGRVPWRITVQVPIEHGKVTVVVPDLANESGPEPPAPSTSQVAVRDPARVPASSVGAGWTARRKLAVGSAAVGVVVAGVGATMGLLARRDHDQVRALCPMGPEVRCDKAEQADALSRSAHGLAIRADVAFGIAGAAALAAGVLWFTGRREASNGVAIAPAVSPDGFTLTAMRIF